MTIKQLFQLEKCLEDMVEQNFIMNEIIKNVPNIKYSALIFMDENVGGDYRIFIRIREEE